MNKKKTKFLGILVALMMIFSFVGSSMEGVTEVYAATVKTVTSRVNFRKGPSTSSSVICKIKKGTKVTYISKSGKWSKIKYNRKTGYVYSTYLSGSSSSSSKANRLVSYAKTKLGKKYVWATQGPNTFDCSGFTYYVTKQVLGKTIPRSPSPQSKYGTYVSRKNLKKGDLVFFDTQGSNNGRVSHAGIYIGSGQFIHASSTKGKVVISNMSSGHYYRAFVNGRRIV